MKAKSNKAQSIRAQSIRAFTLVELLMVMAIICMMLVAIGPSLSSLSSSGYANSISQVAQAFDLARQHAMAKNTYVYVGLYNGTAGAQGNFVDLCVVESRTGTEVPAWWDGSSSSWINAVTLQPANSDFTTVQKTKRISQMQLLVQPGTITSTQIPSLPSLNTLPVGIEQTNGASLQFTGTSSQYNGESFNNIVEFTPNGEARVSPSLVGHIELGFKQWPRNTPAVIRLNGLTGLATVYY